MKYLCLNDISIFESGHLYEFIMHKIAWHVGTDTSIVELRSPHNKMFIQMKEEEYDRCFRKFL